MIGPTVTVSLPGTVVALTGVGMSPPLMVVVSWSLGFARPSVNPPCDWPVDGTAFEAMSVIATLTVLVSTVLPFTGLTLRNEFVPLPAMYR